MKKLWLQQCKAAENIELEHGSQEALDYLIGEKFLNFLEVAERDPEIRQEIPEFVAEIKKLFEPCQIKPCLERARETAPFDPDDYEGEESEDIEMERKSDIRRCASDLLLLESAKEWLLGDENSSP
jgi:hypothetical protein